MLVLRGLFGIAVLVCFAWLLSSNRRRFPWRIALSGLGLQWLLALAVLRTATGEAVFDAVGRFVTLILRGADEGAAFVFGELAGGNPLVPWQAIAGIKIMTTIIIVIIIRRLIIWWIIRAFFGL